MLQLSQLKKLKDHYFLSQPHQPFFILAFVNAIVSMIFFALFFEGVLIPIFPAKYYHAYSFIYLLFTPAFLAFLFTTFSRFSATEPIAQKAYLRVLMFYTLGSLIILLGMLISVPLLSTGIFLTLIGHALATKELFIIYKISTQEDKLDQLWILIAMSFGLLAHFTLLTTLWIPELYYFSVQVALYLYLFLLIFTIAQRMIPFFSHSPIEKHVERFKVIVGLLNLHVLLELIQYNASFLVDLLLSYLFTRELIRWKLPFPNENPLVWILHIALFWIPIAFFLSSITSLMGLLYRSSFLYLGIHTLALGFFLTILIGFGTRVTLGHSGNLMRADNYTKYLFYATQIVVVLRILTSLVNDSFMIFFQLSVIAWLILLGAWGYKFFSVLIWGKKLD